MSAPPFSGVRSGGARSSGAVSSGVVLAADLAARLRECTILMVDDEEANLDLLEGLLESEGYDRLVRTQDPREVPALMAAHAPDLVLLDLQMPHRHGLLVLGDLRDSTPAGDYRPVLVLTADATWEAKERALALGARDFVTKPFDTAEVLLRVENLLDTRLLHLEERRARERAEAAEARSALLADWSRVLAASLGAASALGHLPRLLVPRWASACVATLGEETAAEGYASDAAAARGPALRTYAAAVENAVPNEGAPDVPAPAAAGDAAAAVAAPIVSGEGAVGALVVLPAVDALDQALVDELAARAGMAAEHARLLAAAELATVERERLLAVVAHDMRNPLGAVSMYAEMLLALEPDAGGLESAGDAYRRRAIATIHSSAVGMQRLVEDLLDASSLRGGALRMHRVPQRVGEAFDAAERMLRPLADAAGVTLEVAADDGAPATIGALDGPRLVQLLSNLVGNAIKFTPAGGRVVVRYAVEDDALHASVSDSGPGIAAADLPHLFTAFWRGDRRGRLGVGLGLWIARAIVEAHGGELRVESHVASQHSSGTDVAHGTTFEFMLPFASTVRRSED